MNRFLQYKAVLILCGKECLAMGTDRDDFADSFFICPVLDQTRQNLRGIGKDSFRRAPVPVARRDFYDSYPVRVG